jgi:hypothetical protein
LPSCSSQPPGTMPCICGSRFIAELRAQQHQLCPDAPSPPRCLTGPRCAITSELPRTRTTDAAVAQQDMPSATYVDTFNHSNDTTGMDTQSGRILSIIGCYR